ncbi:hypothetical protein, partial [Stenotrophomonas maltophilia]|uniref:hypothetical protein n=1 Tax=Stenotrophomonas maltophilia TaxID=40324 RepID=UPI0019540D92
NYIILKSLKARMLRFSYDAGHTILARPSSDQRSMPPSQAQLPQPSALPAAAAPEGADPARPYIWAVLGLAVTAQTAGSIVSQGVHT